MIFMNFIIAVISDSYAKVTEFSVGHNYKQMVALIHEREVQFEPEELLSEELFPNILVVRRKKNNVASGEVSFDSHMKSMKQFIKETTQKLKGSIDSSLKEYKDSSSSQYK